MNISLSNWLLADVNVECLVSTPVVMYVDVGNGASPFSSSDGDDAGAGGAYENGYSEYAKAYTEYGNSYTKTPYSDTPYEEYNKSYGKSYNDYDDYGDYGDYGNYGNYFNKITAGTSPSSQTIEEGETTTFTYSVTTGSSVGNKSYQWYYSITSNSSGIAIAGATSSTLTITGSAANDGRWYYCVFSSNAGTSTSSRAQLTVKINRVYDVWVAVGQKCQVPVAANYSTTIPTTIVITGVGDTTLLDYTSDGIITGKATGTTTVNVSVNGIEKVMNVVIIDNPLQALFQTLAAVIRAKTNSTDTYAPYQFAAEMAKTITSFT